MLSASAWDDIRVLDISQGIAGPFCARVLGDFGADVIKVEPPGGEPGRSMPPFFQDDPHPEKSLFFLLLNLNKRGVTLDLESDAGAKLFKELVQQSDVVVESFQPGYLASLGLDYESLERINPRIIMTSITGFGQTGPYSHFKSEEIVAYAMGQIMSVSGTTDREPLKHGGFQAQYEGGINGALATAVAALLRDLSGEGQHVDISIQEVVNWTLVSSFPNYSWNGGVLGRRNPVGSMFRNVMPCKDGYFINQDGGGRTWDDLVDFYGREELREPRFAEPDQRSAHGEEMDAIIIDAVKDRTMKELFQTACAERRILFGIVQSPADLADCPQLESREFFQEVDHPFIGKIKVPYTLMNMSETPSQYRMPAPLLGQHNAAVLGDLLGHSIEELATFRTQGIT